MRQPPTPALRKALEKWDPSYEGIQNFVSANPRPWAVRTGTSQGPVGGWPAKSRITGVTPVGRGIRRVKMAGKGRRGRKSKQTGGKRRRRR